MGTVEQEYQHPAFPQPDDPAIILWRYMDVNKFEWLVDCSRLFMPRADRLGDPFEGTTPTGDLEWWMREATSACSEKQRQIILYNRGFLSRMAQAFRDRYYVSCWHMNQHENSAMWGCYTKQPESIAIKTSYAALREEMPQFVEVGMVRYLDYATERLPTMNMFECIMHKDTYYDFEREVRAVAFLPVIDELDGAAFRADHFESDTTPGFLVYAPPVNLARIVHGVVLHPDASPAFEAAMTRVCANNGLPLPVPSRKNRKPVF
jgi:hypothetical protein